MRVALTPGRRIPAALAFLLFLLLSAVSPAIAGEATPQAVTGAGESEAQPADSGNIPRIVEFTIVPPDQCNAAGVVHGRVGIQNAGAQPARVQLSLTAIERATGREIEVDEQVLPSAGSVEFSLEGDFSGELTGFVAHVRLVDATDHTLQSRLNPIHLPCAEPDPGTIVTLPVTGAGSGSEHFVTVALVALAATLLLGFGGIKATRTRPDR